MICWFLLWYQLAAGADFKEYVLHCFTIDFVSDPLSHAVKIGLQAMMSRSCIIGMNIRWAGSHALFLCSCCQLNFLGRQVRDTASSWFTIHGCAECLCSGMI